MGREGSSGPLLPDPIEILLVCQLVCMRSALQSAYLTMLRISRIMDQGRA